MTWGWAWKPYVSVAQRREQAKQTMSKLQKKGVLVQPVEIEVRKIARTFWGESWCKHLESFSDYENRLPRGRTYVRNGSVCHLEIASGEVKAKVSGSELYDVKISIQKLAQSKWNTAKTRCSGQIGSLLELLQGKLSKSVMSVVSDRKEGFFPLPAEIKMECSCPDWAIMCKHVAAVLYGVGARLDDKPELLFLLRGVDHEELIEADSVTAKSITKNKGAGARRISSSDLEDVFGIEMLAEEESDNGRHKRKIKNGKSEKGTSERNAPSPLKPLKREKNSSDGTIVRVGTAKKRANKMITQSKENSPSKKAGAEKIAFGQRAATEKAVSKQRKATEKAAFRQLAATKKTAFKHSAGTEKNAHAGTAGGERSLTAKSVQELRARLDMSCIQLAELIGVSASSVSKWEKETGQLNLQVRTMDAFRAAAKLSKRQAWNRLSEA